MGCHEFVDAGFADYMPARFRHFVSSVLHDIEDKEGSVHIALSPFVRFFLQLGQTLDTVPSDAFSSVKCTSTSDFRL